MIRVAIDRGNAPAYTGIGVYSDGLIEALKRYAGNSVNVQASGASVIGTSLRPLRRLMYLWNIHRASRTGFGGADVVHFTNVYVPPRRPRVAYVGTIHDLDAIIYPAGYSRRYRIYFEKIVKESIRHASMIFADSGYVRNLIVDRYNIDEKSVKTLGIGLSSELVDWAGKVSIVRTSEVPVVLFVGSLSFKKNTPWLIQSFLKGMRAKQFPKAELVLAGNAGYGFQEVVKELREANGSVRLVSNPGVKELARLYKTASVVVLPSRAEGFGLPLIEAMFFNVPTVASDIPTSREIASSSAFFFELDNQESFYHAINCALADREAETRIALISGLLLKYKWETLVPEYVSAYEEVYQHYA